MKKPYRFLISFFCCAAFMPRDFMYANEVTWLCGV